MLAALIIVFREVFEAGLIIGIVLGRVPINPATSCDWRLRTLRSHGDQVSAAAQYVVKGQ